MTERLVPGFLSGNDYHSQAGRKRRSDARSALPPRAVIWLRAMTVAIADLDPAGFEEGCSLVAELATVADPANADRDAWLAASIRRPAASLLAALDALKCAHGSAREGAAIALWAVRERDVLLHAIDFEDIAAAGRRRENGREGGRKPGSVSDEEAWTYTMNLRARILAMGQPVNKSRIAREVAEKYGKGERTVRRWLSYAEIEGR